MTSFFIIFGFLFSTENEYAIHECFRLKAKAIRNAVEFGAKHCYAVFSNGTKIEDSRGFYGHNNRSYPEEEDKIDFEKCFAVKKYGNDFESARKDWDKIIIEFDREEKYDLGSMNCCTKCYMALRKAFSEDIPLKCANTNFGLGVRWRIPIGSVTGEDNN